MDLNKESEPCIFRYQTRKYTPSSSDKPNLQIQHVELINLHLHQSPSSNLTISHKGSPKPSISSKCTSSLDAGLYHKESKESHKESKF